MAEDSQKPKELRFVYEKARHHRTTHANGAWSGLTPQAQIQVAFYNDLRRMPMSITHPIQDDDTLGPGTPHELTDLVREVDVTVVMNVAVAKATVELLNQMIAQADVIIAERKAAMAAAKAAEAAQEKDKEKV